MRHDKLREWADDVTSDQDKVIPHQVRADEYQTPSQEQTPDMFPEDTPNPAEEAFDYSAGEVEEEQAPAQAAPVYDETEAKARQMGWVPKDEWRGNPDDWTSAKRFVQTGEVIQANRALHQKVEYLEQNFDQRLNNMQLLHQAELKNTIDRLKAERDAAVENADTDRYKQINDQIENLEQSNQQMLSTPTPIQQQQQLPDGQQAQQPANGQVDINQIMTNAVNHPVVVQWRNNNPWVMQDGPKQAYAEKEFTKWITSNISNPNATLEQGLAHIDALMKQAFPAQPNPNQAKPSMAERRGGPVKRSANVTLTMSDLTHQEREIWRTMGKSFKNQKDFLRAVQDDRASKAS